MGNRTKNQRAHTRQEKQAKFHEPEPDTMSRSSQAVAISVIAALVIAFAYVIFSRSSSDSASVRPINTVNAGDQSVQIPLTELSDGEARFYRHSLADNRQVEFFAVRSSDGVYRAAFNACDVCYPSRQGYRQEGDDMVCNKCNQRFPSQLINELKGGCNPAPLQRTVVGNQLVIRADDLQTGGVYF